MMKKFVTFLILVAALYFVKDTFFSGSGTGKQAPPVPKQKQVSAPTTQTAPAQTKPQTQTAEPQKPVVGVWPYIKAGGESLSLADSMTAKNIVMVFDGSGSMNDSGCSGNQTKIEVAKKVVKEWADLVPVETNLGLIVFDKKDFSIRLPLGRDNRLQFREEIDKVVAKYKTPLTKSLHTAFNMLTEQGQKQLGYGDYTIVVVTDGVANDVKALKRRVDAILANSPVMIHTIGFCINDNHALNTRGRTVYKAANNPAELRQGLQDVLAESESFDISGFE